MTRLISIFVFSLYSIVLFSDDKNKEINSTDLYASRFIQVKADTRELRSELANLGMSIEWVRSDSVWGFADPISLKNIKKNGFDILGDYDLSVGRGGHQNTDAFLFGFPDKDSAFHDYEETIAALKFLQSTHADIAKTHTIGKTIEGRDIVGIHINSNPHELKQTQSNKPGVFIVGMHHAREHLSSEIPLKFAQYLLENRYSTDIKRLIETRDIWIFPMLNSDGLEHDISDTDKYKNWRKNRRDNGDGSFGVDLNRNYGFMWGTGGSSKNTRSDVYMGESPFSEPETASIKKFIESRTNIKVLLTVHTFSELILYPWGHTFDPISNRDDLNTFKKMAETMAAWNKYKPQSASSLYIASGDTVDWAYGEHGIFGFTFELTPKSMWEGGFYIGAKAIERVFNDNLRPLLYLLEVADNPHKVHNDKPTGWLKHYVQPTLPVELFYGAHPIEFIGKSVESI